MLRIFLFTIITLMCCCCTYNAHNKKPTNSNLIEKAKWLIGKWEDRSSAGYVSEIWEYANDSTFLGKSYFVQGKDTVSSETIILKQVNNTLFYIPSVKNQNEGKPVEFKLKSSSDNQLVFENAMHDFPQKITYTKITSDSLHAEISGLMNGKYQAEQFPLKKAG